jgi:predicted RND superfamily exporter protein
MATSIAFGLGLSTLLVLLVIPALLSWLEQFREWRARRHDSFAEPIGAPD